jgi:uncharacterized glyoxalase superfamily protein PhnB
MKPVDLARRLRREAAFEPAALERGKAELMTAIRQEVEPRRRPTIVPQLPYQDIRAALSFLERAFGFREITTARLVSKDGVIGHSLVEFGDGVIGIGTQGAHGAISPKSAGMETQYISVSVADIDAHHQRALAAGAQIAQTLRDHRSGYRSYEALDLEGHRWRFIQQMRDPVLPRSRPTTARWSMPITSGCFTGRPLCSTGSVTAPRPTPPSTTSAWHRCSRPRRRSTTG